MLSRRYLVELSGRAHDREGFVLRVSLPALRAWTREDRAKIHLRVERLAAGAWIEVAPAALTEAECGELRAYYVSRGASADPTVVHCVLHVGNGQLEVTRRDGSVRAW